MGFLKDKKEHTFCPKLWEEFFIVEDGTVFPCCERPKKVGDLYENKLEDICNSLEYQKMREDSLKGKLSCYRNCRLLYKNKIKPDFEKKKVNDYGKMKKLRLLFSEKCNLNCIMCHQNSGAKKVLDIDVLKKNIDLSPFELIDSQGGESLFIKEANEYFDYAVSQGKKISLLTNGVLINDLWAEKVALHSDFVHISLNSPNKETHEKINRGSSWERVTENIQKIKAQKEKHGTDLNIIGHMTLVLGNLDEIPQFIGEYRKLGFDTVNFGFTRSVQYYLKFNFFKRNSLKKKIAKALQEVFCREDIDTLRLELIGLV